MALLSKTALQSLMDSWAATFSGALHVRLFKNNLTPTPDNVVGDFTESTFTGYAAISFGSLGADGWTDTPIYQWAKTAGTYTFNGTGGVNENVYGYYVTDGGGNLLFSHRFAGAPLVCGVGGTSIQVNLTLVNQNLFPS